MAIAPVVGARDERMIVIRHWHWKLVGSSAVYRGPDGGGEEEEGVISGELLGDALLSLVNSWEGFEVIDDEEPFTLMVSPVDSLVSGGA